MLTIISVSFRSKKLIDLNYELVKKLNPNTPFEWIVVQNTPENEIDQDINYSDPRFTVIKGPYLSDWEKETIAYGSFHHAKALTIGFYYAKSDFILTLDPDCFILAPNWIENTLTHLTENKIAFMGTPYHSRFFYNYRTFPTVVCMFINRKQMYEASYFTFNFFPAVDDLYYRKSKYFYLVHDTRPLKMHRFFAKVFLDKEMSLKNTPFYLKQIFTNRFPQFGIKAKDTGYELYEQYSHKVKHEEFQYAAVDQRRFSWKCLEMFLPDRMRTYPRSKKRVRNEFSKEFEHFEPKCEEFYWKNQLFAIHISGTYHTDENKASLQEHLLGYIQNFTQEYPSVTT